MKNIKYIILCMSILFAACQGEKGIDGSKGGIGPAGANGADGIVGAKGPQGDKGATGDVGGVGDKGSTKLIATSTAWVNYDNYKNGTLLQDYKVDAFNSINISGITTGEVTSNSAFENALLINDKITKKNIGTVYLFNKLTNVNNSDTYYTIIYTDLQRSFYSALNGNLNFVTCYLNVYLKKASLPTGIIDAAIIEETKKFKSANRLVFIPVGLAGGRYAAVDMTDYEEVKKAYNLKD